MTLTPWREKWFVLHVEALEAGTVQPCAWDLPVRTVPLSKAARHSCSVKPPPREASAMAGSQKDVTSGHFLFSLDDPSVN